MRHTKSALRFAILLTFSANLASSCLNIEAPKVSNNKLLEENKKLKEKLAKDSLAGKKTDESKSTAKAEGPIRVGAHSFSLQWIGWEIPGAVTISDNGDGTYHISGSQKSTENSDYVKINGTIKPVSALNLSFNGTIESQVTHLNNGQPCVKTGNQTFLSVAGRKFWRLQNMDNCDEDAAVDYVDIYF